MKAKQETQILALCNNRMEKAFQACNHLWRTRACKFHQVLVYLQALAAGAPWLMIVQVLRQEMGEHTYCLQCGHTSPSALLSQREADLPTSHTWQNKKVTSSWKSLCRSSSYILSVCILQSLWYQCTVKHNTYTVTSQANILLF